RWSGIAVDEVDGDQPLLRCDLAVGADAADVMRVPEPVYRDATATGGLGRPDRGVARYHLAVAIASVPDREIPALAHHLRHLVRNQRARFEIPHVMREHPDAVAVVAGQIGVDEMIGDDLRLRRAAAGLLQEGDGEAAEPLMIDAHGRESGRASP